MRTLATAILLAGSLLAPAGPELFGFPTKGDPSVHFAKAEAFLPRGVTKVKVGMKLAEVRKLRAGDSLDADPLLTPFSLVELNRAKGIALDRTSFHYDEGSGIVDGLWLRNELATAKREHFFELTKALYRVCGRPGCVYELKEKNEIGLMWKLEGDKQVLLRLQHDPATWPSIDFHVGLSMLDAAFVAKLESAKIPFPKDFLAFLNGFLDEAFPE